MIPTPEDETAAEYVLRNRERLEVRYLRAIRGGAEAPIVLALDLCDPRGRSIAEATGRGDEIPAHLAEAEVRGTPAALFGGMPGRVARLFVGRVDPELAAELGRPTTPGYFKVLGVHGGGLAIVELPNVAE